MAPQNGAMDFFSQQWATYRAVVSHDKPQPTPLRAG